MSAKTNHTKTIHIVFKLMLSFLSILSFLVKSGARQSWKRHGLGAKVSLPATRLESAVVLPRGKALHSQRDSFQPQGKGKVKQDKQESQKQMSPGISV